MPINHLNLSKHYYLGFVLFMCLLTNLISCKKETKELQVEYKLPTVQTGEIQSITKNSADIFSKISSNGGLSITETGICYSKYGEPTIDSSKTNSQQKIDTIINKIENLLPNTTYFVRAYAVNKKGVSYGETKQFKTSYYTLPQINDFSPSVVLSRDVYLSYKITQGDDSIIEKRVCVSYTDDIKISQTIPDINVTFFDNTIEIYYLKELTTYYCRLYIITKHDKISSNVISFTTTHFDPFLPEVLKPNIYLYPTEAKQLQVKLRFPKGGSVTRSIPEYGSGWNVSVAPSGLIDNTYTYLFYESSQPDVWQTNYGWIIKHEDLKTFFIGNLTKYGFKGTESTDFTDYWIPRLSSRYYVIYPQESSLINTVNELVISEKPEQCLRLWYVIEDYASYPDISIKEPIVNSSFKRQGFYATEWGVILK